MSTFYKQKVLILQGDRHLLERAELSQFLTSVPLRIKSVEVAESSKGALPDIMQNRVSPYIILLFWFSSATRCNWRKLPAPFTNRSIYKSKFPQPDLFTVPKIKMKLSTLRERKACLTVKKRKTHISSGTVLLTNCHIWQTYKKTNPNQQQKSKQSNKNCAQALIYNRNCPQLIFSKNHHSWWIAKDYVRMSYVLAIRSNNGSIYFNTEVLICASF